MSTSHEVAATLVFALVFLTHPVAQVRPGFTRIERDWCLSLPSCRWGTSAEHQYDEKRGELPSTLAHCAAIGSMRLGSWFLRLPTCELTGQQVIFSDG